MSIIDEAAPILQPMRYKILMAMRQKGEPMYIDEIARKIDVNHRLVSFHLAMMQHEGFLASQVGEIRKANSPAGRAGRFYRLTPKVEQILSKLKKELGPT